MVTPLEHAGHFSEAIIQLPHCYQANNLQEYALAPPPARAELGLPEDAFVFCCFCANNKFTPKRFAAWVRILRGCPHAVLWLWAPEEIVRANLRREAEQLGLGHERLIFADRLPRAEHLRRMQLADLFLDTAPYGAHTTASDALWAGVPVLTVLGETFASRVTASIVHAAGLDDLILPDEAAYERQAVAYAHNPRVMETMKQHLRAHKASMPLFDMASRVRELETAYESVLKARKFAI